MFKTVLCTIIFIIQFINISAQSRKIDSLNLLLKTASGITRYDLLKMLTSEYGNEYSNYKEALRLAKECYQIANENCDTPRIVTSSRMLGQIFRLSDRFSESKKILYEALLLQKKIVYRNDYKMILNTLGGIYTIEAKYDKALSMNFKTLLLREQDGDQEEITIALNNIALVYYYLNNYAKALEFYNRALKIKEKMSDHYEYDRMLINTGLCYIQLNNYKRANQYFNKAFEYCAAHCSEHTKIEGNHGFGLSYLGMKEYTKALNCFKQSYLISIKNKNKRYQAENLYGLFMVYNNINQNDSAFTNLAKAEKIAFIHGFNKILLNAYKEFSFSFRAQSNYKKASYYQHRYIELSDSIYNDKLTQNLMVAQAEYEQRQNSEKIVAQEKILALKEDVITRQNILNILAAAVVLLLAALIVLLFKNNIQRKRINRRLEQKVKERTRELEFSYQEIQNAYMEQSKFIYKLSNDLKTPLSTMKGLCALALHDFKYPKVQEYIKRIDESTNQLSFIINKI